FSSSIILLIIFLISQLIVFTDSDFMSFLYSTSFFFLYSASSFFLYSTSSFFLYLRSERFFINCLKYESIRSVFFMPGLTSNPYCLRSLSKNNIKDLLKAPYDNSLGLFGTHTEYI